MVRIPHFDCPGLGSVPGQGTEVLEAARFGQEKKKKERERINVTLHSQQLAFPEDRSSQPWLSMRTTWELSAILLPGFHPRHGEGDGTPLQYSCLEKSHGWRSLVGCSPWGRKESDMTERLPFHALEKEMATHSSVLAWRIPGMGEPGGLPSMGLHRVGHD